MTQWISQRFHPRTSSISQGLIVTIAAIVILTVLLGALPAVGAILLQLKRQVESRIQDAQQVTYTLYAAERERLSTLVSTFAERPTLCSLVKDLNTPELTTYLETLREGTSIDALSVVIGDQHISASGLSELPQPVTLLADRRIPFTDYTVLENPPRLVIIAADSIQNRELCDLDSPAWVLAVQWLDNQDMRALAQRSGLEQSLIIGGYRTATSLDSAPTWSLNPEAAEDVGQTLLSCCTSGASQDEDFYIGLAPLVDNQGKLVAISEVALPGNAIIRSAWTAIGLLLASSLLIAAAAAYVGITLVRRITRPLNNLAASAEHMSKGDLERPVPTESGWTEINQLAEQLEISRRYLRKMFQINQSEMKHYLNMLSVIREGVVVFDNDGLVVWLNPYAEEVLGRRAVEVLRSHYSQVFLHAPGSTMTLGEILEPSPGQPQTNHITILDAEKNPRALAVSVSHLDAKEGPGGQQERVLIFHDLGEEAAYNRLRSEFLANMAHEFRTPLSSIAASIEMLSDDASSMSPDELAELANTTLLSTQHLQALVNNLLERFTIDAGLFRLRCHPVLMQNIIRNNANIMMPLLMRRNQQLILEAPDDLPTIWADQDRLGQVLINLLENASKFSPFGNTITISAKCQENMLLIAVVDRGSGIPLDQREDLFRPFYTVEKLHGAQNGIGLGLSVVKAIIEAHGGQIGVENISQGGARVWFTLPIKLRENVEEMRRM